MAKILTMLLISGLITPLLTIAEPTNNISFPVTLTAYSSTPEQTDHTPFITASGAEVEDGVIAANFLDFGTEVMFPEVFGDKIFIVKDRMNRRKNKSLQHPHWVDIWMAETTSAKKFGLKQNVLMKILNQSDGAFSESQNQLGQKKPKRSGSL